MDKTSLGDRMKNNYEDRTRFLMPRRNYVIIRIDGKAFHTYTRNCERPYDKQLRLAMTNTAIKLCKEIQGANFAYCQSDEISILITDFNKKDTNAWFDYNLQKMCSVSASMATAFFNDIYKLNYNGSLAFFDSRVFQIPDEEEVKNYFVWRQKDAERNSIQMLAQSVFSHKELCGKSISDIHEMLYTKDLNWNDVDCHDKAGSLIYYHEEQWKIAESTPIFTQDRGIFDRIMQKRGY